jgi:tetratricopeptide (TPR) repeat protein
MLNHTRRLPLLVALAAFVIYACTMGRGMTLNGAPLAARLAGWNEAPLLGQPLLWLVTLPLRLLPLACLPLALKLFAAILAAGILWLLTRTVQLLPWDRPWDNASSLAWQLPGLTAGIMCGLEFSFWQEATSTCGELLDLLLLASALWLLLEYNVRRQAWWLNVATVVWGLGMAENWVMLFTWPLFVLAVIWLEGLRFFRWNLILRLTALGLAGGSVYAVLPMANSLLPHSSWSMAQSWMASLSQTKSFAHLLYHGFWRSHRLVTLTVVICFLVPALPLLVRMPDEGTRNKSAVDRFQVQLYRGLRLCLLLTCFWLALDPLPGARQTIHRELEPRGRELPLLTFDYLNALGAALLVGNLLLIARSAGRESYRRSRTKTWPRLAVPLAAGGIIAFATALVARNAPAICHLNFQPLEQFGTEAVRSLPSGPSVVLSDEPDRLAVFRAALAHGGRPGQCLPVDTRALPTVAYRQGLEQRRPAGWLTEASRHELTPGETVRLLENIVRSNRVFYLNPCVGLVFERFTWESTGAVYELKLRGTDPPAAPALPAGAPAANERFWTRLWDRDLSALVAPRPTPWRTWLEKYGFTAAPRDQDRMLAQWYGSALEGWAVTLQKEGNWRAAQMRFEQVLQLDTNNFSARLSLACNASLQAGRKLGLEAVSHLADELGNPRRMSLLLAADGPFDAPALNYVLGCELLDIGLLRQSSEALERSLKLAPHAPAAEMVLAEVYNRLQLPERSRPLITDLREATNAPVRSSFDLDLALQDSYSWILQTNLVNARAALQSVVRLHPDDPQVANRVAGAYIAMGDLTNAMQLIEGQLTKTPEDVSSLNSKAMILMEWGQPGAALPILDHILTLTNLPAIRMNRVFAHIALRDFASAKSELKALEPPDGHGSDMVAWGLAVVAEHEFDTNAARHYLQLCLSNAPPGGALWQQAVTRLRSLEPAAPVK